MTVSPPAVTLAALQETTQFMAEARATNGAVVAGARFSWSTSDQGVATVDASGQVRALSNGSATIAATSGTASGSAKVTVKQVVTTVSVSPAADSLVTGDTLRLVASPVDANGHTVIGAPVAWVSSDTSVADVGEGGLVHAHRVGRVTVTAESEQVTGRAELTVVAPEPTTVVVTPMSVSLDALGATIQLSVEVRDQAGRRMANEPVEWASEDQAVATVDSTGLVTAEDKGRVRIVATADKASGSTDVTVMQTVSTVVISPASATVSLGDSLRLDAEGRDGNGRVVEAQEFRWSSDDESVARVDNSGLVTGLAEGTATISASADGVTGHATITVANPDRAALVAFYRATAGHLWTNNDNWLTDAPLATWYGVSVNSVGRVSGISLPSNGLRRALPSALGNLKGLRTLNLRHNQLVGPIPPTLTELTELESLSLQSNELTGPIPPNIASLDQLWNLALSENDLTGEIPPQLGRLQQLAALLLNSNAFKGSIPPELGNLSSLQTLWLQGNALTGPIPPELGRLRNIRLLDLGRSRLSGSIPAEFGQLTNLRKLQLQGSGISGPIPPELGNLSMLEWLSLGENDLTGNIPPELGQLKSLTHLSLGGNELSGPIPTELGQLSRLQRLYLYRNALTGPIPAALGHMTNLTDLILSDNSLSGPIPPELGALPFLEDLSLDNNNLTGSLPPELGNLSHLDELFVARNHLSGHVPTTFLKLQSLSRLTLGSEVCVPGITNFITWLARINWVSGSRFCNEPDRAALELLYQTTGGISWTNSDGWLGPAVSDWHGVAADSLGRVVGLDLRGNGLAGRVPRALADLTELVSLKLDRNDLSGPLPVELSALSLHELSYAGTTLCVPLDESFTRWLGTVPSHIGTGTQCDDSLSERDILVALYHSTGGPGWTNRENWLSEAPVDTWHGVTLDQAGRVRGLFLNYNSLSGEIPRELGTLEGLEWLFLHGNRITGVIPEELADLATLRYLGLQRNRLLGPIPPRFGDLSALVRLLLGHNELTGEIPRRLGNLTSLQELDLGSNALTGAVPSELGNLTSLQRLYLHENQLTGDLPTSLGRLENLTILHAHWNQLTGETPAELANLSDLQELSLFNNALTGSIPQALGNLKSLRELDLGGNELLGSIPPELSGLEELVRLGLWSNRLEGSLPPELSELSQLEVLGVSNNQLTSRFPPELANLTRLEVLNVSRNRFSGTLPSELGRLQNLKHLYLDNNDLEGPVPAEFLGLDLLQFWWRNSGVCVPASAEFESWLENVDTGGVPGGPICVPDVRPALMSLFEATGGSMWLNRENWGTSQPIGEWYGTTVDTEGRLRWLDLQGNGLSGGVPSDLGDLTDLQRLDLAGNELTGELPTELGNLTNLLSFRLGNNRLDGPLPGWLVELPGLIEFSWEGSGLCAPEAQWVEAWLESVQTDETVEYCRTPVTLTVAGHQMTQAVQNAEGTIPLLSGRPALLRVFFKADRANDFQPRARATLFVDGREVHRTWMELESPTGVPEEPDPGILEQSFHGVIAGDILVPGVELVVDVDPDSIIPRAAGSRTRLPPEGRLPLDVRRVAQLDMTVLPVLARSAPDSSVLEWTARLGPQHPDLEFLRNILPVGDVAIEVREDSYVTGADLSSLEGWSELLREVELLRLMEGYAGYVYAAVGQSGLGIRGLAGIGGSVAAGVPDAEVWVHELGHNLRLRHAPCGFVFDADPDYPYGNGNIGTWGFDFRTGTLLPPSTPDVMGYCGPPSWISDYHFEKALRYRLESEAGAAAADQRTERGRRLLLWGGRGPDGKLSLDPAFALEAPAKLPAKSGSYRLVGFGADGERLFRLNFGLEELEQGGANFLFAIPLEDGWLASLERIVLSGPEGEAELDRESNMPMAIVLDRRTRQIREILRGPEALRIIEFDLADREGSVPSETDDGTVVLGSRGLPGSTDSGKF